MEVKDFVIGIEVRALEMENWATWFQIGGVAKDVGKDGEFFWTLIIRFLFSDNFLGTHIFDLHLSSENLTTYFWVGGSETRGSQRENLRADSRPISYPFLSLISTNSSLNSIDFPFWFLTCNVKEQKIRGYQYVWNLQKLQQPLKVNKKCNFSTLISISFSI